MIDLTELFTNPLVISAFAFAVITLARKLFETETFQFPVWFPSVGAAVIAAAIYIVKDFITLEQQNYIIQIFTLIGIVLMDNGISLFASKFTEPDGIARGVRMDNKPNPFRSW